MPNKLDLHGISATLYFLPVWDYQRLVTVGKIAIAHEVDWLTADF